MKRFILYTFFILSGFSMQAQNGNRLEALKIAYITKKMDLSPEEAQKFWPIYNQYAPNSRKPVNRQQEIMKPRLSWTKTN